MEEQVCIGKIWYRILPHEQAEKRRVAFISNPDMVAGVEKLEALMGHKNAKDYFSKVLENLTYEELDAERRPLCPRPTFHNNPNYICTHKCPKQKHPSPPSNDNGLG